MYTSFFRKQLYFTILCFSILLSCSSEDSGTVANPDNPIPSFNSANDFLSDIIYKSLNIEIVYMEGHSPTTTAVNNLVSFLNERTHKPEGIEVDVRSITSPNVSQYSTQDIISIESSNRTQFNNAETLSLFVMFLDGEFSSNSDGSTVLGIAYADSSFAIFQESIEAFSGGLLQPDRAIVESTVINHEMGHLLGLTNFKSPMQTNHEDSNHPKHCTDTDCLMYWSIETGEGLIDFLSGGQIPNLDPQCIADLQANGGK